MDVSENNGTPKSSILMGFSIINHPFWGTPIFGNTHMCNIRKGTGDSYQGLIIIKCQPSVGFFFRSYTSWWLNQPIWKICASQIGSFPYVGMKIKIFETTTYLSYSTIYIPTDLHISIYIYAYMHICIYAYTYVYIYICVCVSRRLSSEASSIISLLDRPKL